MIFNYYARKRESYRNSASLKGHFDEVGGVLIWPAIIFGMAVAMVVIIGIYNLVTGFFIHWPGTLAMIPITYYSFKGFKRWVGWVDTKLLPHERLKCFFEPKIAYLTSMYDNKANEPDGTSALVVKNKIKSFFKVKFIGSLIAYMTYKLFRIFDYLAGYTCKGIIISLMFMALLMPIVAYLGILLGVYKLSYNFFTS